MAVFTLPIDPTQADNIFEVSLDGVSFRLEFILNSRDGAYYMNVRDSDDVILRSGLKIVSDWAIDRLWIDQGRPEGFMITVSSEGEGAEDPPGLGIFGDEVLLTYSGNS